MRMTFVFQFLEMNQDQLFFFSLNLFIGSDNGISIFCRLWNLNHSDIWNVFLEQEAMCAITRNNMVKIEMVWGVCNTGGKWTQMQI